MRAPLFSSLRMRGRGFFFCARAAGRQAAVGFRNATEVREAARLRWAGGGFCHRHHPLRHHPPAPVPVRVYRCDRWSLVAVARNKEK